MVGSLVDREPSPLGFPLSMDMLSSELVSADSLQLPVPQGHQIR